MSQIADLFLHFIDYRQTFREYSERTTAEMQRMFRDFLSHTRIRFIDEYTLSVVESWFIVSKRDRNWSPKTIRVYLSYHSLFADWCVHEKYLVQNFVADIPKPRLPKREPDYLSENDTDTILLWARNHPYHYRFERFRAIAIIATFLATGIRRQELINLKMCDVDLEQCRLRIKQGKGNKDRTIPFTRSLARVLKDYLRDRQRMNRVCPWFFTAMRQDSQMGPQVVPRLVSLLRQTSGVYFTPHLLRHTYITRLLEKGFHIGEVQRLAGHASIHTTAGYAATSMKRIQDQMRVHGIKV